MVISSQDGPNITANSKARFYPSRTKSKKVLVNFTCKFHKSCQRQTSTLTESLGFTVAWLKSDCEPRPFKAK